MKSITRAETKIGVGDLFSLFGPRPPGLFCALPPIHLSSFIVPGSPDARPQTLFYVQMHHKAPDTGLAGPPVAG